MSSFHCSVLILSFRKKKLFVTSHAVAKSWMLTTFPQPSRYVPCSHTGAPYFASCLVKTLVWSLRWVKECNCSSMGFPDATSFKRFRKSKEPQTVEPMSILSWICEASCSVFLYCWAQAVKRPFLTNPIMRSSLTHKSDSSYNPSLNL